LKGDSLGGLIAMFDPLSYLLRGKASDQWFVYGSFYTIAVLVMGFKFIFKYRHNRYQQIRTFSVMLFQLLFAWLLPGILVKLYNYEPYFTYFFPLDYDAIFPSNLSYVSSKGALGQFAIFWGLIMTFLATPVLTYYVGKRWYCSWVCGCGGLAETAGDPFRHLSDKSLKAWKIERWLIHSVLASILIITVLLLADTSLQGKLLGDALGKGLAKGYGLIIGSIFSGVIGVGFYPLMGSRVWCRFGCPMAAYLGLIQRFKSRFRITTNGGQCISCGNCSTYCEMGIDVRWYAQRNQNIVRASCVGCGVCSAVCPRGVLKLENGPDTAKRTDIQLTTAQFIPADEVNVLN
ncbi:MAG: 4Fe-4S binding protein, partial [Chitinophagales bacterium]